MSFFSQETCWSLVSFWSSCLAGFDDHLKDRYRNAVRRVQPANVQEVTADAMQNLSR